MTWLQSLLGEMDAHGLAPRDGIIADGEIHRFDVEGDRIGSKAGWYVVHADSRPAATFGSWKTGERHVWHDALPESAATRRQYREQIEREKRRRESDRANAQQAAAVRAADLWNASRAPSSSHRYLRSKAIAAHGLHQLGGALLVPMRDTAGALWNVQRIFPDGSKRFLRGGRLKSTFHVIGEIGSWLWIAEGYATAASLHADTGEAAAVAFCCSNLLPAGLALRHAWPSVPLLIMADNDVRTPGNPGVTAAKNAAAAVGCDWYIPEFPPGHTDGGDFNDAWLAWRAGRALG